MSWGDSEDHMPTTFDDKDCFCNSSEMVADYGIDLPLEAARWAALRGLTLALE
jgi:hypothetical protein